MFSFKIASYRSKGGRTNQADIQIDVSIQNHQSPLVLALHKLEEISELQPRQSAQMYRLKRIVEYLTLRLNDALNISLFDHTKESFEDLLYSIEQAINNREKTSSGKCAEWGVITTLFKLLHQPMNDGAHASSCISNYLGYFKGKKDQIKKRTLQQLAVIPHNDVKDLEKKAILATKELQDDLMNACGKDIDEYLKVSDKQNKFGGYRLNDGVKSRARVYLRSKYTKDMQHCRQTEIIKAFSSLLNEELTFKFLESGHCDLKIPSVKTLPVLKGFKHYMYNTSIHPWWFCRYRLPNYVLTSCYLLLLVKTGWNINSVGNLKIKDIKKITNGTYELQAPKHKSDDETPTFTVSKADKYLKICLSLLIWNHAQLVKYNLISSSDENVWYGWQRSYAAPIYPLDCNRVSMFFLRHKIPPIPPSEIRPLVSSLKFLKHHDLELVRTSLGHSSLETTKTYIENNLVFHLNEARILEFQRRMEATIAFESNSMKISEQRGFDKENVDLNLISRKSAKETEIDTKFLNEAKSFLTSIGANPTEEGSIVTIEALRQTALLKNYYRLRWKQLCDKNPEFFAVHHINIILYVHAFLRIAKERRPILVKMVLDEIGGTSR